MSVNLDKVCAVNNYKLILMCGGIVVAKVL